MISFGHHSNFFMLLDNLRRKLQYDGKVVDVGEWQSIRREQADIPQQRTIELQNVVFSLAIPTTQEALVAQVHPNLPFAEAQFQDRVSGNPLNPPPSDQLWPWARHLDDDKSGGKYSHTYPERFWPKRAGFEEHAEVRLHHGIRFAYGDLDDVVSQLTKSPYTRQAYLPVWFPEDTGVVHGERVPCTLGYHFLFREGRLHCTYFIRSVDFFRHFPDDVYMAGRLLQWVVDQVEQHHPQQTLQVSPGNLTMHMCSLHVFEAERKRLERPVSR